MRAPERPYPSFSLVLSQLNPARSPTYSVFHFGQSQQKSSRVLDLEDPLMRTVDTRYDGILTGTHGEDSDTLVDVTPSHEHRGRRLSLSTLVIDLALAVKYKLDSLRLIQNLREVEHEVAVNTI